jgi:GH25 family lysozyme M1 (1,4-beta-N-acetylmuramidase)
MARKHWRMAAVAVVLSGVIVVPFVRNALADSNTGGGQAHAGRPPGSASAQSVQASALPSGYNVLGIDVSKYSHSLGNINWAAQAAQGVKFAYIKATEGTTYVNPYLGGDGGVQSDYTDARNAGLFVGAYAWGRPDNPDAVGQANFFIDHAGWGPDSKTLIPFLDIEWPYFTGLDNCYNLGKPAMASWIRRFVDQVKTRIGRAPMIYTAASWWNQCVDPSASFADCPLDLAYWQATAPTVMPTGWSTFAIWQYAGGNTSQVGNYDKDVINGDINALRALAGPTPPTVVSLHAHAGGHFVTAEQGGDKPLIANRWGIGSWEQFDEIDLDNGYLALRSHANGHYVTAENGGQLPLVANRMAIGGWEQFQVVNNTDGSVSFKARANGKYVTAENAGTSALIARATAIGSWQVFDAVPSPTLVSLRARANGRYITAENGGAKPLIANRTTVGSWEQFEKFDLGNGHIALRARANGRVVTAENGGVKPLIANRTAMGPWETFTVVNNGDGSISLRAMANGKYVTAENGGALPLIANRAAIGGWEEFDLV